MPDPSFQKSFVVSGQISQDGRPLPEVVVKAFDRDLRHEELLGEAITDKEGRYKIAYSAESFARAEKYSADLIVRVFMRGTLGKQDVLLAESNIIFNAKGEETVDLAVVRPEEPVLSAFEKLLAELAPVLQDVQLADLTDEDVIFLVGDTRHDQQSIEILRSAARLSWETGLPTEAFYAWARQPGPLALDLERLLAEEPQVLLKALQTAITQNIIPTRLSQSLDDIMARIEQLRIEHGFLVVHEVMLQLIAKETDAQKTGAPLVGFTVHLFDLSTGQDPKDLGHDITDDRGVFTLVYTAPGKSSGDDKNEVERSFRLDIFDRQGKEVHKVKIPVKADQKDILPIPIPVSPALEPPSPRLTELDDKLGLGLPTELLNALSRYGIRTLADVRNAGGIGHLEGLPLKPDDQVVQTLEAHANLSTLSPDLQLNATLINKNYTNIHAIARKTRAEFVTDLHDKLGDFKAAQIHVQARAQDRFLGNVLAGLRADAANGFPNPTNIPALQSQFPQKCGCQDCDAAVSQAAYLADLLDYAVTYVKNPEAVALSYLTEMLHQPFGALPAVCAATEQRLRQVRICIEVLRRYLGAHPQRDPAKKNALANAEKHYCLAVYTALLNRIGTSYEEIRFARTADQNERQALANRLGFDLTAPYPDSHVFNELKELFLDTSNPNAVTEQSLEKLFGLVDTTRDPLSEGVKLFDFKEQITHWNLDGVEWNRNTDRNGTIHVSLSHASGSVYRVNLYRDYRRRDEDLVASGERSSAQGAVELLEKNHSGLSGIFEIAYRTDTTEVEIVAVPHVLSWRLHHLCTLWTAQDWPPDPYRATPTEPYTADDLLPIIDPDVIGPDDFRSPLAKINDSDPDEPFDLWKRRRDWADVALQELVNFKGPDGLPDLTAMLKRMKTPVNYGGKNVVPWAESTSIENFPALKRNLSRGQDIEATERTLTKDLKLSIESFTRLMEIKAEFDREMPIPAAMWDEVYSILVQAQKRTLFAVWRTEEQMLEKRMGHVLFGPKYFWMSLRQPAEGDWPPLYLRRSPQIDPETMKPTDLPWPSAGTASAVWWQRRQARLSQIYHELKSARETDGVDSMLKLAFGDPNPGDPLPSGLLDALKQVQEDLGGDDQARVNGAKQKITTDLHMKVEEFVRFMEIETKAEDPDPTQQPTEKEWAEVYAILTSAQKRKREYSAWINEEKMLPLLDPDHVTLKDLPEPTAGRRAIALWQKRQRQLREIYDELEDTRKGGGFEAMLRVALGDRDPQDPLGDPLPLPPELDLDALKESLLSRDQTVVNKARLQITTRLYMMVEDFDRLMKTKTKNDAADPQRRPTDKDWSEAYAILTQARKLKEKYPQWIDEERSEEQSEERSPDYWRVLKARLPKWRATIESRQRWQQALRNRSAAPHIDPDVIGLGYVRDVMVDDAVASGLWTSRQTWIQGQRDALHGLRGGAATPLAGFDAMLVRSLFEEKMVELMKARRKPPAQASDLDKFLENVLEVEVRELTGLFGDLNETNPDTAANARRRITDDFSLTEEAFRRLMVIRESAAADGGVIAESVQEEIFGILSQAALAALVSWVIGLEREQEAGGSIPSRLEQLNLPRDAFAHLLRVRELLAREETVLSSECDDVYNILVQVRKRRTFADWRREEQGQNIILGPEHFKIPESPRLPFRPPKPEPLTAWRATWRDRRDWRDRLETRLEQQQSVIDVWQSAVSATEETTLPVLRDALIMATDAGGSDLAAKAKWVTDHLLIDAAASGCQMTTRISQALETIQGLLWSLRTGQLKDTYPNLVLQTDNFDEEWQWIGSNAAWRAAMMVFLYPENVLLPSLRRHQTPAFRQLVEHLRASSSLTSEQVCEAAKGYSDYFRDVANLTIEATCQARTRVVRTDCDSKEHGGDTYRDLFYMFARSEVTGNVYWSTYDPTDQSGYGQTFWEQVPGLDNVLAIVGAVPYAISASNRSVFLFTRAQKAGEEKLGFTKYDLEQTRERWDRELTPLEPPPVSVETILTAHIPGEQETPTLVFHSQNGLYIRPLDLAGTTWKTVASSSSSDTPESEWDIFKVSVVPGLKKLHEVHDHYYFNVNLPPGYRDVNGWWISFTDENQNLIIGVVSPDELQYQVFREVKNFGKSSWLGALSDKSVIYVFFDDYGRTPKLQPIRTPSAYETEYRLEGITTGTGAVMPFGTLIGLAMIIPLYGVGVPGNVVINRVLEDDLDQYLATFSPSENLHKLRGVAPQANDFLEIRQELLGTELAVRRELTRSVLLENSDSSQSILTYLEEAYYFVPIYLALELHRSGEYIAALDWFRTVYDYSQPEGARKIYYGLEQEELLTEIYKRSDDWLLDPLNPHQIASTRANTYTRFTLLSLVRCFLDYADAEFTRDTAESIPRARTLYMTALELLGLRELNQHLGQCGDVIGGLLIEVGDDDPERPIWWPVWLDNLKNLRRINDYAHFKDAVERLKEALALHEPWHERITKAQDIVAQALAKAPKHRPFEEMLTEKGSAAVKAQVVLLAQPAIAEATQKVSVAAGQDFLNGVSLISGVGKTELGRGRVDIPWLREGPVLATLELLRSRESSDLPAVRDPAREVKSLAMGTTDALAASRTAGSPRWLLDANLTLARGRHIPVPSYHFCIPPNPIIRELHLRAELNLYKLRNCRNIAGMEREVEPYTAPTDTTSGLPTIGAGGELVLPGTITIRPTPYRYRTLIDRAKQLVSLAQQIETAFLSALQNRDAELYNLLKARQDARLARAGIRLQDLRVREAEGGVELAKLQQGRVQIQDEYYSRLLEEGLLEQEQRSIAALQATAVFHGAVALMRGGVALIAGIAGAGETGGLSLPAALLANAEAYSSYAAVFSSLASLFAAEASYERRRQEWEFQRSLAQQDIHIGAQQIRIAEDHVRLVGQEHQIAVMQANHADEIIEFLNNKFTSAELFDWMSSILEGVYSFFLQQATAMARLAENQLAFERQEVPSAFIQADYWEAPTNSAISNAPDRRGLTGSARLLQDIYRLDQHAFETDKRKLQLTKVISLARLAPFEFQQFRETGVMTFATPMEMFDRDFPGHYLRLIKRVRTSVIALIPPTQGIHATLSTSGISRVVIGGDLFQPVIVRRDPESIALTAPQNATGLFELEPQSEMLFPFEGGGVATTWELRMPKAANFFDYRTIADVLISIGYTALDNFAYRQQVIQQLNPAISADRPFSFRHQFADQWYDLHNPDQTDTPMVVQFETRREDFPPNLENLHIQEVMLYFSRANGQSFEIPLALSFTDQTDQNGGTGDCEAGTSAGLISTRGANGSSWLSMQGKLPFGKWKLSLPDTEGMKNRFKNGEIEDILFVITYKGDTLAWPR